MVMIKNILLFALGITVFASCNKDCDSSTHNVGFYYQDTNQQNGEKVPYKLFIDNVYRGDLPVVSTAPACGDVSMLYIQLDGKRHELDVKNDKGEYVNSQYLQFSKNKTKSGSGKNSKKVDQPNGGTCSSKPDDNCVTFGFFNSIY